MELGPARDLKPSASREATRGKSLFVFLFLFLLFAFAFLRFLVVSLQGLGVMVNKKIREAALEMSLRRGFAKKDERRC